MGKVESAGAERRRSARLAGRHAPLVIDVPRQPRKKINKTQQCFDVVWAALVADDAAALERQLDAERVELRRAGGPMFTWAVVKSQRRCATLLFGRIPLLDSFWGMICMTFAMLRPNRGDLVDALSRRFGIERRLDMFIFDEAAFGEHVRREIRAGIECAQ